MQANILRDRSEASAEVMNGLETPAPSPYNEVNAEFYYTIEEKHAIPILSLAVHDMSSEDNTLRGNAYRLLIPFVELSGYILNGSLEPNQMWSRARIWFMVDKFLLKHMGNAMNKRGTCKKVLMFILSLFLLLKFQPSSCSSLRMLPANCNSELSMRLIYVIWISYFPLNIYPASLHQSGCLLIITRNQKKICI